MSGCASSVYRVQTASFVPIPALPPPPSTRGDADLYLGDNTVAFMSRPNLAPNENAGLYLPRTQLDAAVSFHPGGSSTGGRLVYRHAFSGGAFEAAPTTLPNPNTDAFAPGLGLSLHADLGADGQFGLDVIADLMLASIPSFVRVTCVEGACTPGEIVDEHTQRDEVFLASGAVFMTYTWNQRSRIFVALAFQNHPTNIGDFETIDRTPEVEPDEGPVNFLVGAGADIVLTDWLSLVPQIQTSVTARPVRYGPIFGIGLRGTFGATPAQEPAAPANAPAPVMPLTPVVVTPLSVVPPPPPVPVIIVPPPGEPPPPAVFVYPPQ